MAGFVFVVGGETLFDGDFGVAVVIFIMAAIPFGVGLVPFIMLEQGYLVAIVTGAFSVLSAYILWSDTEIAHGWAIITTGFVVFGIFIATAAFVAAYHKKIKKTHLQDFQGNQVSLTPSSEENTPQQFTMRLQELANHIPNIDIRHQVFTLHFIARQILDHTNANPNDAYKADMFFAHYLPKSVQMVEQYIAFSTKPVQSANVLEAVSKLTAGMVQMKQVFTQSLDNLYSDIVQEINTNLEVLEHLAELEGIDVTGE